MTFLITSVALHGGSSLATSSTAPAASTTTTSSGFSFVRALELHVSLLPAVVANGGQQHLMGVLQEAFTYSDGCLTLEHPPIHILKIRVIHFSGRQYRFFQ